MPDPREIAKQLIQERPLTESSLIDYVDWKLRDATGAERQAVCDELPELIRTAVVAVTWPDDEPHHIVTRGALVDAISRIEIRRIKPEGGVVLVAAETLADAILAVVEETS